MLYAHAGTMRGMPNTENTVRTVQSGPLQGWPLVNVGDGEIAVGRHCWNRESGTFTADEAWAAWSLYWNAQR